MSEKHATILTAAQTIFARYGVQKTTMNDIASEAGVARQTVYNAFPSKAEILRAVVRRDHNETFSRVTEGWAQMGNLGDMIDLFFEHGPLRWHDVIQSAPDMEELIEGIHSVAAEEIAEAAIEWKRAFEDALVAIHATPVSEDTSRADLAEFFYFASVNAKYGAPSRALLEQRLKVVRMALLALVRTG